jgi:hypothetical protein
MASAWGYSFGSAFGSSFGSIVTEILPNFGDIIQTQFIQSTNQIDTRMYGFSEIRATGDVPAVYHAGDVVYLPYQTTEVSTIEAMGLAWAAYLNGITPN